MPVGYTRRDFVIPLRDGVRLATAEFLPLPSVLGSCCLLLRTDAEWVEEEAPWLQCALGYGLRVLVQQVRGRGGSGGEFMPWLQERADGGDVLEWLAGEPGYRECRFILYGEGYAGQCAVEAALAAPERMEVAALMAGEVSDDLLEAGLATGGVLNHATLLRALAWAGLPPETAEEGAKAGEACWQWAPGHSPLYGAPGVERWFLRLLRRCALCGGRYGGGDEYRVRIRSLRHPQLRVLLWSAWGAPECPGTLSLYEQLRAHCVYAPEVRIVNGVPGEGQWGMAFAWAAGQGVLPVFSEKKVRDGISDGASHYCICGVAPQEGAGVPVGGGQWESGGGGVPFYLGEKRLENRRPPPAEESEVSPVSLFRRECPVGVPAGEGISAGFVPRRLTAAECARFRWGGGERAVFWSAAAGSPVLLAGIPHLRMWVHASRADGALCARLVVVWAEGGGGEAVLSYGAARLGAQRRDGRFERPHPAADEALKVEMTMRPVAEWIPAGACFRLEIASAEMPHFIAVPNCLAGGRRAALHLPAVYTVFHSREYPSRLSLPLHAVQQ